MAERAAAPVVGDRAFALDAGVIVVISFAICLAADRLALMTVLVPAVLATRFVLWSRLPGAERGGRASRELLLFGVCLLLGGFNDWNSVARHGVYEYTVPHRISGLPVWMLLYWGMILRFLITLFRWSRLDPPARPRDAVHLGGVVLHSAALKVALQLGLVLSTRQLIYRHHGDPLLSWLPFALALVAYALLFRPDRGERFLIGLFAVGGPLVEVLYIQVGGLHRYDLGWLGGVPLWIALWWILAMLIWRDVSQRVQAVSIR